MSTYKYPSVVHEMRDPWLHGQSGGQQLLGYLEDRSYINVERTIWPVISAIMRVLTSPRKIETIAAWEIQAEERDKYHWS